MQKSYKSSVEFNFTTSAINWECELCNFVARDSEDILSISSKKICTDCFELFKDPQSGSWRNNSKPTREVAHKRLNIFIKEV